MTNKKVFIFDIDGCIMPNIFKNYGWEKDQVREELVKEVNQNGRNVRLYPAFVDYFRENCKNAGTIYFVTGRHEKDFGRLTCINLAEIIPFKYNFIVVFYPPEKRHKNRTYFKWKLNQIKNLIKREIAENGEDVRFYVFDDLMNYYAKLNKFVVKNKIFCSTFYIKSNMSWEVWKI